MPIKCWENISSSSWRPWKPINEADLRKENPNGRDRLLVGFPPEPRNQQWGDIVQASHQQQIGSAAQRHGYVHPGPNQGQIPIFGQASTSHQQLANLGQESTIHQQLANLGQDFGQASTIHQQLHPGTNQGLAQEEYVDFGYDLGHGNFAQAYPHEIFRHPLDISSFLNNPIKNRAT